MSLCPYCGEENIDGADVCEACQQPLDYMSKPQPTSAIERSVLKGRVDVLAPRPPVTVDANTPVSEVLKILVERRIGCVIVTKNGDLAGIFSERDALVRLGAAASELKDRPVSEFMTPNPETVDEEARIAFALHKMDIGGYRHLPVMDEGQIKGVISVRDILGYITDDLLATQK
jgi:CBS domain-containing protein